MYLNRSHEGDKWQSKTLFLTIFDLRSSIVLTFSIAAYPMPYYFSGIDPMGLFWSLTPCPGQGEGIRLVKKDVSAPKCYHLQAIPESSDVDSDRMVEDGEVLTETTVEKLYQRKGVKRIPVAEGRLKGTLFVPEGIT